ncbi:MAG: geranylgeranyl reductase [Candidatus Bathyarchaeota archaeon B63]|nr:MAG: geranylgeranyl reductase [Candidatus Bathyarchaeota archaeon B63]
MSRSRTEILVVGAGPAGLIAAREASKRRVDVLVLEEHREIGLPCHCAGLLSLNGLRRLGITLDGCFVQNMVRGAIFHSPSGLSFRVEREEPVACVVDRVLLDRFLAHQALESGAEIRLGCKARDVDFRGDVVKVGSGEHTFEAEILIDAEGSSSRIVRAAGLEPLGADGLLSGLQLELAGVDVDQDYVEVHLGRSVAPGFFAWVIPLGDGEARVGLGCSGADPRRLIERFLKKRFGGCGYKMLEARSGRIIVSGPIKRTYSHRLLVVGDAAGHVKPTTGGGVILGGICAAIAGKVASEAVKQGDLGRKNLSSYERIWRRELGREFRYMLWARRIINSLPDRAIDKLFELLIKENIPALASEEGDMDFQSSVITGLIRRWSVVKLINSFLKTLRP